MFGEDPEEGSQTRFEFQNERSRVIAQRCRPERLLEKCLRQRPRRAERKPVPLPSCAVRGSSPQGGAKRGENRRRRPSVGPSVRPSARDGFLSLRYLVRTGVLQRVEAHRVLAVCSSCDGALCALCGIPFVFHGSVVRELVDGARIQC